jgi:hypothetical protein
MCVPKNAAISLFDDIGCGRSSAGRGILIGRNPGGTFFAQSRTMSAWRIPIASTIDAASSRSTCQPVRAHASGRCARRSAESSGRFATRVRYHRAERGVLPQIASGRSTL